MPFYEAAHWHVSVALHKSRYLLNSVADRAFARNGTSVRFSATALAAELYSYAEVELFSGC
jgi:hypothetical protein